MRPILKPDYNGREIVKQLIAIEEHLTSEQKRCFQCVALKHCLSAEQLAEEAKMLIQEGRENTNNIDYDYIAKMMRDFQREAFRIRGNPDTVGDSHRGREADYMRLAQSVRKFRKELVAKGINLHPDCGMNAVTGDVY